MHKINGLTTDAKQTRRRNGRHATRNVNLVRALGADMAGCSLGADCAVPLSADSGDERCQS